MLNWLSQNAGTIVVLAVVIAVVAVIVVKMIKNRKNGKSSCDGGCARCTMAGKCHYNQ